MKYAWHVVKYVIVFIVNLLILLFVHSYFNFVVMVLMIIMPVVSICCAIVTSRRLVIRFGGGDNELVADEPFLVSIILDNKSILPNMNVNVRLTIQNELFGVSGKHELCIPAYAHRSNIIDYQITQSFVGATEISTDGIRITDWMGFVRISIPCSVSREFKVFPAGQTVVETDMTAMASGMNEAEESNKKGYDFSEVVDVREYQPGDKLQNIHWKLSAKKGQLMVKERESMSSSHMLILVELYDDSTHVLNDVLKASYGVAVKLLEQQISFSICYWSTVKADIVHMYIDDMDSLRQWMEMVFYEKTYDDEIYGFSMLEKNIDPDKKVIVITTAADMAGGEVFTYGQRVKGYISG